MRYINYIFIFNILINFLFFFILIHTPRSANASYYLHPELDVSIHIQTPVTSPHMGKQLFNITKLTTNKIFNNLCNTLSINEISNRIVVYDGDFNGCSHEDMGRNVQNVNGLGIIFISQNAAMWGSIGEIFEEVSPGVYCLDGSDRSDIYIPLTQVVPKDIRPVVSAIEKGKKGVIFQLTPDPNPYIEPFDWFLFYRIISWVILAPWCILNLFFASDTLRRLYYIEKGYSFQSLPQLACSIEIISNLVRLIYVCLGPFATWNIWNYFGTQFFMTLTFPLSFLTSLIIAIFWKDACDRIKTLTTTAINIHKYRYLILIMFLGEISTTYIAAIMRAMYKPVGFWVPINALFEFTASGGLSIYFIIQGRRFIRILEDHDKKSMDIFKNTNTNNKYVSGGARDMQKTIAKMSKWIIASAFFTFFLILSCIGCGSPFFYTRWGMSGFLFLSFIAVNGISSTQIIAFRTQVTKKRIVSSSMKMSNPDASSRPTKIFETQELEFNDDEIDIENI